MSRKFQSYFPEFAQLSMLPMIFGLSKTFFEESKKSGLLKNGIHYFYVKAKNQSSKSNKRLIVWDLEALRAFIRANPATADDTELDELLNR